MTNTNKAKALAGSKPQALPGLYEVSTLGDGTVIIKQRVAPETPIGDAGKATKGAIPNA